MCLTPGRDFNPRSHEGSDGATAQVFVQKPSFQSTLPRRERPSSKYRSHAFLDFNPRSHEGSDVNQTKTHLSYRYNFNPRSHEGSDNVWDGTYKPDGRFQSTLPRRERQGVLYNYFRPNPDFNPRSHEGSDADRRGGERILRNFNPRSHEGSDIMTGN